jgi:HK97 family phage prohead protease
MKTINFIIKDVNTEGVDTIIEGWANKAVVDRGKDYIGKKAWNLVNYEKNPVILFNHDKEKPIGRALGVEATDDGLYIKAKISKSKDPMVSYVRDMIKEGILNAFSVGFDAKEEGKDSKGVNEITQAELYEVSVVSLPMNQDSIFTLTTKDLKKMKSYNDARKLVMATKGAQVAAGLLEAIDAKKGDAAAICELVAETSGASLEDVKAALAGDLTPVPEKILSAFAATLELKVEDLQKINGADEASGDATGEVAQSFLVSSKACGGDISKAKKMCEDAGYPSENMKAEGENFVSELKPSDQFTELKAVDLGDGCSAMMGKLISLPLDPAAENPPAEMAPAEKGLPMDTNTEIGQDDNPYLMQSRQTNILLGTLIEEFRKLSKQLESVIINPSLDTALESQEDEPETDAAQPPATMPENKTAGIVYERLSALDLRLKLMGV